MALTYGIESLAVINKGGGLRRLAAGQTTQYLRGGDMTWTDFPTTMAPVAHNHTATDITSGTLEDQVIQVDLAILGFQDL